MTLHAIVAALGGDLYQRGRRANVPAPGHGAADRSVSLLLSDDRVVVHTFGSVDWLEVMADLRARGLVDGKGALLGGSRSPSGLAEPTIDVRERRTVAMRLWAETCPLGAATLALRHLRRRGVAARAETIDDLRHHPRAPLSVYRPTGSSRPALVARISDREGRLTGVELTYLDPNGRKAAGLRLARKTVGSVPAGSAVRLAKPGDALLVGEGLMTVLSASARFGLPGWALMSAGNLSGWRAPSGVRRVLIAADRGRAGEAAAGRLEARLSADSLSVEVVLPPAPFGDWNEAEATEAEEGR